MLALLLGPSATWPLVGVPRRVGEAFWKIDAASSQPTGHAQPAPFLLSARPHALAFRSRWAVAGVLVRILANCYT
jgi:hypothetical protein